MAEAPLDQGSFQGTSPGRGSIRKPLLPILSWLLTTEAAELLAGSQEPQPLALRPLGLSFPIYHGADLKALLEVALHPLMQASGAQGRRERAVEVGWRGAGEAWAGQAGSIGITCRRSLSSSLSSPRLLSYF